MLKFSLLLLLAVAVSAQLEGWIVEVDYILRCGPDLLPGVDNCKCSTTDLISLATSGKMDSISQGGSAVEIMTNLFSDAELLATLCRYDGCAAELFEEAINFEAFGVSDPLVVGAIKNLGSYVCAKPKSHSGYCLAELAPLAAELDGKDIAQVAGSLLGEKLQYLCSTGCISQLAAYQDELEILVKNLGGAELAPLLGLFQIDGGLANVCSGFDNCVIETKRECMEAECYNDCEWGNCAPPRCNSASHKTLGYDILTNTKDCCAWGDLGFACAEDGWQITCCRETPTGTITCPTPKVTPQPTATLPPTTSAFESANVNQATLNTFCDASSVEDLMTKIAFKGADQSLQVLMYNVDLVNELCQSDFACTYTDILKSVDANLIVTNTGMGLEEAKRVVTSLQNLGDAYCVQQEGEIEISGTPVYCLTEATVFYNKQEDRRRYLQLDDLPFKSDKLGALITNCDIQGLFGLQDKFEAAGGDIVGTIFSDPEVAQVLCKKPQCPEVAVDALDETKLPPELQDPLVLAGLKIAAPKLCIQSDVDDSYCVISAVQHVQEKQAAEFCDNNCLALLGGNDFIQEISPLLLGIGASNDIDYGNVCGIDIAISTPAPTISSPEPGVPKEEYCESKCNEALAPVWDDFRTIAELVGGTNGIPETFEESVIICAPPPNPAPGPDDETEESSADDFVSKSTMNEACQSVIPGNNNRRLQSMLTCQEWAQGVSDTTVTCDTPIPTECATTQMITLLGNLEFLSSANMKILLDCVADTTSTMGICKETGQQMYNNKVSTFFENLFQTRESICSQGCGSEVLKSLDFAKMTTASSLTPAQANTIRKGVNILIQQDFCENDCIAEIYEGLRTGVEPTCSTCDAELVSFLQLLTGCVVEPNSLCNNLGSGSDETTVIVVAVLVPLFVLLIAGGLYHRHTSRLKNDQETDEGKLREENAVEMVSTEEEIAGAVILV